ncbi:MAG: thiamine biosynthesis protein [Deltaproteobacteria bacterium]|nr:thiamine biosynthesis protein [Candidatus Anaeroferrophillus wilburensis]MBN2888456.1 thiamine biosynthesis protein [Deltaproteobacteria bacterium]
MTTLIHGIPIANPQAVALFSTGLDSILAVKVLQRQHLAVQGLYFTTPFFNNDIRGREDEFIRLIKQRYRIPLCVVDISSDFLTLLEAPPHGYGKNFNPCIDCKILMVQKAKTYAKQWGAGCIVTGEVLGQRPFSQRRDTMRIIERDSDTDGMLLRPLSARLLKETVAEQTGLVDRTLLYDFSGRGRKQQLMLAAELGITDFPTPAGGCLLTDPAFARRIQSLYAAGHQPAAREVEVLKYGRFYPFAAGTFLAVGRNKNENQQLLSLATAADIILKLVEMPGPVGFFTGDHLQLQQAGALLVQHSKARNQPEVTISWTQGKTSGRFRLSPLRPETAEAS